MPAWQRTVTQKALVARQQPWLAGDLDAFQPVFSHYQSR